MASGLTPEYVIQLMNQGMKQIEIAQLYQVSRQYVGKLAKRGGHESIFIEVGENLPWEVPVDYIDNTIYKALRLHRHYMLSGGTGLKGSSHDKLKAFYRKLVRFNQVVDFDPEYPAVPGLVNSEGFAYVPRQPEDKDFIIKMKPSVRLTPIGDKIWRMPPKESPLM